jgi:hypothetical protein
MRPAGETLIRWVIAGYVLTWTAKIAAGFEPNLPGGENAYLL